MTRVLLLGGMVVFTSMAVLIGAEEPAPPIDLETRKASIAHLETHIAQREARLAEWGRDIVELDARIEKRVDELVKMLAGLRDSQDSRTKVSQIKKEAIESLRSGIDRYVQKRREISELVRAGDAAALDDLGKFDERVIKRVDQIVELTKSIPTHEDVEKYESDGGSYWNGYYYENSRISEEWKQNRLDRVQSDKQREDTAKALKETLDRLDQRRRSLVDLLGNRDLTESARQLYTRELGQFAAYQDHLNAQLRNITTATREGGSTGGEDSVGLDQAHDIEVLLDDARKDLREDVSRLFRSYDQFVKGRAYLDELKKNLAERKEWLKQNDPATKQ